MNFLFYKSSKIFTFCIVFIKFALMGHSPLSFQFKILYRLLGNKSIQRMMIPFLGCFFYIDLEPEGSFTFYSGSPWLTRIDKYFTQICRKEMTDDSLFNSQYRFGRPCD